MSQVVFNYKRCHVSHICRQVSDDEESPDEEHDDTLLSHSDTDSVIEFNHTLEDFESLIVSEPVVIGEEVVNSEWLELEDLSDLDAGMPYRVNVKVSDETFVTCSFCCKSPELTMQCTDSSATWKVLLNDEVVATIHPNCDLSVRGYYFLHMEELVLQFNGQEFPLKEDPEFQEFLNPSSSSLFLDSRDPESAINERVRMFMQYLHNHLSE